MRRRRNGRKGVPLEIAKLLDEPGGEELARLLDETGPKLVQAFDEHMEAADRALTERGPVLVSRDASEELGAKELADMLRLAHQVAAMPDAFLEQTGDVRRATSIRSLRTGLRLLEKNLALWNSIDVGSEGLATGLRRLLRVALQHAFGVGLDVGTVLAADQSLAAAVKAGAEEGARRRRKAPPTNVLEREVLERHRKVPRLLWTQVCHDVGLQHNISGRTVQRLIPHTRWKPSA